MVEMKKGMLFEAVMVLLLIFLVFLVYLMVATNSNISEKWALSGVVSNTSGGVYNNMFIGNDGTVYTIDGKNVSSISPDGRLEWSLAIPNLLDVPTIDAWGSQRAVTDNGTLYIDLLAVDGHAGGPPAGFTGSELLAISSRGKLLWNKTFISRDENGPVRSFYAKNGLFYALYPRNLTVYDGTGAEKWSSFGVQRLLLVDDTGTAYLLKGLEGYELDACTQDGIYLWHKDISDYGLGSFAYGPQELFYHNHTIYLPLQKGLVALDEGGSVKWKKSYDLAGPNTSVLLFGYSIFSSSPFDDKGTIYLREGTRIFSISPDGTESTITDNYNTSLNTALISPENGLIYTYQTISANNSYDPEYAGGSIEDTLSAMQALPWASQIMGNRTLGQIDTLRISAISIGSGNYAWSYTLPLDKHTTVLNRSNYRDLVPYGDAIARDNLETPEAWYRANNITTGKKVVVGTSYQDMATFNGALYVNFWSLNYEVPSFFGQSECTYSGGIYAFDKAGSLLWYKPTNSMVSTMKENNGTLYYSTIDGKLYANKINAFAGFVLTAALYIFIRFFLAGAVIRARSRIDSNKNRNLVLKFIGSNPGASLYDISKSLSINLGTVRYHLMILGINHRITSYKADDKYVRYFTNAGSYSKEQQFVISLMRREGIKNVLKQLLETPGLTNLEMANELGIHDSSTIRYLKELLAKGIVIKDDMPNGKRVYLINDLYKEEIAFAVKRFNDQ